MFTVLITVNTKIWLCKADCDCTCITYKHILSYVFLTLTPDLNVFLLWSCVCKNKRLYKNIYESTLMFFANSYVVWFISNKNKSDICVWTLSHTEMWFSGVIIQAFMNDFKLLLETQSERDSLSFHSSEETLSHRRENNPLRTIINVCLN